MSSDPTASPPPAPPAADAPGSPGAPPAGATATPGPVDWSHITRAAIGCALAGAALYLGAGVTNLSAAPDRPENADLAKHAAQARFTSAFLTGFTYWLSLPIGAMALLLIGHLAKTSWGLLLRRPFEAASRTWPLLFVLFAVLAFATASEHYSPYYWTHPHDLPEEPRVSSVNPGGGVDPGNKRDLTLAYGKYMIDKAENEARKARDEGNYGFLSVKAFFGVGLVLFAIWAFMITLLNKWSREAAGTREQVETGLGKLNYWAGPGLIIYAITITAAATQWVMSAEAGWSSTMFPVIFAVNQFLTTFAFCLALFLGIVAQPQIAKVMRPKFQIDMGTLLLAFTLFWTYTSFSQFMLVWVGNLPEEIPFYLKRSSGGWWWVSAALAVLHFALPFLLLLFRDIKMNPVRLRRVAMYLVVICGLDVVWWNAPAAPQYNQFPSWLMDVGAILAIGGVWALYFVYQLKQRDILPIDETYLLPEGHHHESH